MKKLLYLIIIASVFIACNQQENNVKNSFTIDGNITAYDSGYVYLHKVIDGELKSVDSVLCLNGKFSFNGNVNFAEIYYLSFGDQKNIVPVFLENADITIKAHYDSIQDMTITGSKAQDEYKQYRDELLPFENKMKDLYKQYKDAEKEGNEALMEQIDSTYEALDEDKVEFVKNYVTTHNKSVVSPYILNRELSYQLELKQLDSIVNLLDESLNPSPYFKILKDKIETLRNVEVGKPAPDFTLNDTTGNPVIMSSFKGKYLLIDFWASWCGDCRRENPNIVKLYADYKDRGLEILGVALDKKRESWVNCIKSDGLTWPQVSDLNFLKSEVGKLYGVSAIPHTVLLDKDGIIIAKNLTGDKLRAKIAELLD